MKIPTAHNRQPQMSQSPTELADQLKDAGLAEQCAEVYARSLLGMRNVAIADDLGVSQSAVAQAIDRSEDRIESAKELVSITDYPEYVSVLSMDVVDTIYESDATEGYLGFSIHNPVESDRGYELGLGSVIEGYYIHDADEFLLIHHNRNGHRGEKTGILVTPNNLTRFLVDWVFSDRFGPITNDNNSDEWFLTGENKEPEWLENELRDFGIEPVEAMTDDRFINPIVDSGVHCSSGAKSGRYMSGYKIAYQPTDREVAELLVTGEITEDEAHETARKTPAELREIASAESV